jgi:hypothetical protein
VRLLACRDLQWAWLEYSRAAEYAHDPHALVHEELSLLGPAGLCPACAGTQTRQVRYASGNSLHCSRCQLRYVVSQFVTHVQVPQRLLQRWQHPAILQNICLSPVRFNCQICRYIASLS